MQVPMRLAIILFLLIVGILFGFGILQWNKDAYKCFDFKRPYGDWVTIGAVGKLELRVKAYGCEDKDRYYLKDGRLIHQ